MMKNVLIILPSVAVVLGIITFIVVFYGGGNYVVTNSDANNNTFNGALNATSSPSSSLALASSTASSTTNASSSGSGGSSNNGNPFSSDTSSAPVTWKEGNETMTVTGASYDGTNLTLDIQIVMGPSAACVPLNLRLIANEAGQQESPTTPGFTLPNSGNCNGAANAVYGDQPVVFNASNLPFPILLTTGGSSNLYFEVGTTTYGGVNVFLPPTSG